MEALTDIPQGAGEFALRDGTVTFKPHRPPSKFKKFPFQIEDLATLVENTVVDGGSANWSDMGCFKTTTGLWLMEAMQAKRILIITTRTGKTTFFQTIPYLLPDHELKNLESTSKVERMPSRVVVLAHYNLFTNRSKIRILLQEIDWDFILIDEAHRIKNRDAQWTKNIKKLKATNRHIMTGTGFINKPDEIWSLLHFLYRSKFRSYWRFRRRYCIEETSYGPQGQYTVVKGIKEEMVDEFKRLVYSIGVRRTKEELFHELPALMPPTKIYVDLNATQRKMYDMIRKELYTLDKNGYPITAPQVLSMLTRLRQICVATPEVEGEQWDEARDRLLLRITLTEPSSKLDALVELLEGTDLPSVIFTQFSHMAALTCGRLGRTLGYSQENGQLIWMQAKDDDVTRSEKIAAFQRGTVRVFISTIALGSESITLTAADKVIFLDRSWSPANNNQAIARVYRPGQTRPVQPIYIEAANTVDQYVETKLAEKEHWFNRIFGDKELD